MKPSTMFIIYKFNRLLFMFYKQLFTFEQNTKQNE